MSVLSFPYRNENLLKKLKTNKNATHVLVWQHLLLNFEISLYLLLNNRYPQLSNACQLCCPDCARCPPPPTTSWVSLGTPGPARSKAPPRSQCPVLVLIGGAYVFPMATYHSGNNLRSRDNHILPCTCWPANFLLPCL